VGRADGHRGWLQAHPRPGINLRQLDLPGLHSKTIEEHAAVLCELFDMALPEHSIDTSVASGAANLARRYGFRTKPVRLRFRMLDPRRGLLGTDAEEDITVDHASFARLAPAVSRVFVTENEVNVLAFPPVPDAMVLFGAGYGFDALDSARWLNEGDIDTHGFAILAQLRGHFAHVESFLMDHATLMTHRSQWTDEARPVARPAAALPAERAGDAWRAGRYGSNRSGSGSISFSTLCWVSGMSRFSAIKAYPDGRRPGTVPPCRTTSHLVP
jgi:hypothetical protein